MAVLLLELSQNQMIKTRKEMIMKTVNNASSYVMWSCLIVGNILGFIHGYGNTCMLGVMSTFILDRKAHV